LGTKDLIRQEFKKNSWHKFFLDLEWLQVESILGLQTEKPLKKGTPMKNMIRSLFLALTFFASTTFAFDKCDAVGSYIAVRLGLPLPDGLGLLNQLQLHSDGTAYFYASDALLFPLTTGEYAPMIGAWELKKDIITMTLITFGTLPTTAGECCDLTTFDWQRYTFELRIVDKNTLERLHTVVQSFPNATTDTNTVLFGSGNVVANSTTPFQFKKVHVVKADLAL